MKRLHCFWTKRSSILSSWIKKWYIKDRDLAEIVSSSNKDSSMWRSILRHRENSHSTMDCGGNYSLTWKGHSIVTSLRNFCLGITPQGQIDHLASGIWSKKPTKFSVLLWKLRWGYLPSFKTLRQWGVAALSFVCYVRNLRKLSVTSFLTTLTPNTSP